MKLAPLLAAVVLLFLPRAALAVEAGDVRAGELYARSHCSECHAVESTGDLSPDPAAPSFASVAGTEGMTGRALAVWLETSHPTMPDLVLSREDRDNVIAYILSLRRQPSH